MPVNSNVPIGSFLAQQGLNNLGQFTGLALGPGLLAKAQGSNLSLDAASSSPSPSSAGVVVFRPGAPSDGAHVETWAEVEAAITAALGNLTVIVDSGLAPAIVPSTADTECYGRLRLTSFSINSDARLTIEDGGRLKNLATLEGLVILGAPTARIPLYFSPLGFLLYMGVGASIANRAGASVAMIEVDSAFVVFYMEGAGLNNDAAPAVPLVKINPGQFFSLTSVIGNYPALVGTTVQGDATAGFLYYHDGSVAFTPQPLMTGFVQEYRTSQAAALLPSSGATGARPTISDPAFAGQMFFDTTINLPVWWNGAVWVGVDPAGAAAAAQAVAIAVASADATAKAAAAQAAAIAAIPAVSVASTSWLTALDIDLTTHANLSLAVDGTYTIGGVAGWKKENSINDRIAMAITNGVGLVAQPGAAATYSGAARAAPLLWLPLSALAIAGLDWSTKFRIWINIGAESVAFDNPSGVCAGIDSDNTAWSPGWAQSASNGSNQRQLDAGVRGNATLGKSGGVFAQGPFPGVEVGNLRCEIQNLASPIFDARASHCPGAAWPAVGAPTLRPVAGYGQAVNSGLMQYANAGNLGPAAGLGVVLAFFSVGGATNYLCTIKGIRVDYRL